MEKYNIALKNVLASLAENLLPSFSGQNKILEIVLKMTDENEKNMFSKIVFWHPNNYMLVAYDYESSLIYLNDDEFEITANHDSTWKYDGLNFFRDIMTIPEEIEIVYFKVVQIEEPFVDEVNKTFTFKREI